jgi:nitrous oxidase accessory protein
MGKGVAFLALFFLTASCLIAPLPANAGAKTIVVPDDYPTITAAIGNATNGDTILVREGTYEEPINQTIIIDKTLFIIGENAENTIIKMYPAYNISWILTAAFFSYSDAITINADNVRISNLTISLVPGGYITTLADMTQIIDNNIITAFETGLVVNGSYCNITDNNSGGSISLNGFHNIIARNSFYRVTINKDFNIISNNTLSGDGVNLSNASNNVIYENNISSATADFGVSIVDNSFHNIIYNNNILARMYDVDIRSRSAENNTFYNNNFLMRLTPSNELVRLYTYTLTLANFWDNGEEGNYWEDYNGTDANRDGIGDTPYVIDGANVDNYPLMFPYDIENDTVVLPPPEPFPITLVIAASGVSIALIVVGLLVYFRKRKH